MLGGTYSTGTISVTNGSATVTGIDVLWNDVLEGDELWPTGQGPMLIGADVVHPFSTITLMKPWPGTTAAGITYVIVKTSWKRHDVTELQKLWRTLAADLEATGNYIFVEGDEPDPEMGENGQFALKVNVSPWRMWYKEFNVWEPQGIPVGTLWRGYWDDVTAYNVNDMASRNGSTYVAITANTNQPPELNPDDWELVASSGSAGADGGVITIPYYFSTNTNMVEPGNGIMRLDNPTQNLATSLVLDTLDNRGIDFTLALAAALGNNPVKGQLRIHRPSDTSKFLLFNVTTDYSAIGYHQYLTSCIGSSSASPFVNAEPIIVNITRAGDVGAQGGQGAQGSQGLTGAPGGFAALPYTVDALNIANADPGFGKMRFTAVPQRNSAVLRFSNVTTTGAPVGPLLSFIGVASSSTVKVGGRVFINGAASASMHFTVTSVEALGNYHNLNIAVQSASTNDPFANNAAVIFDFSIVGDKGDAASVSVGATTTAPAGTDASVINVGSVNAAVLEFTIPEGLPGQNFSPTHIVATLPGRDAYDSGPVINPDGTHMSVLVESDSSNGNLPTMYFLQSTSPAVWSEGFTFEAATAATSVVYDNDASGLAATDVQGAIDETNALIRNQDEPVAMALIFGRW